MLDDAEKLDPGLSDVNLQRGLLYFNLDQPDKALEEIDHGNHDLAVQVLKKSAELGLTAIVTPERYGGMELDLASLMVAAEHLARDGS